MDRRTALKNLSVAMAAAAVSPRSVFAAPADFIHVKVSDGVSIGLAAAGSGPSLLLVHGSGTTKESWAQVTPLLAGRFRTFAMDRRGRGASTDGSAYSLAREAMDVAEVAQQLPPPVFLVGHSYGAVIGLEALTLAQRFQRAVLYEPPLRVPGGIVDGRQPADLCAAAAGGDNDRAMTIFFRNYVLLPEPAIAAFRASPAWPQQAALAPSACREARALANYAFDPRAFTRVSTPTLLLLGEKSPRGMAVSVHAAAAALPHARVAVLPGQQHLATRTAPGMLADQITHFMLG